MTENMHEIVLDPASNLIPLYLMLYACLLCVCVLRMSSTLSRAGSVMSHSLAPKTGAQCSVIK